MNDSSLDFLFARQYDEDKYNCAHLVCEAWKFLAGEDLSEFLLGVLVEKKRRYIDYRQRHNFKRIKKPIAPCIVDMRTRGKDPHVGIYIDTDSVLQITYEGVQNQPLTISTRDYEKITFWRMR